MKLAVSVNQDRLFIYKDPGILISYASTEQNFHPLHNFFPG